MGFFVTAFRIDNGAGAGWVSARIVEAHAFSRVISRPDGFLAKTAWAVLGMMAFPFLHPIFARFAPVCVLADPRADEVWLNLSQTFALSLLNRSCVLVAHDLQCHCGHRLSRWVAWSERLLLRRAKRVVVMSKRDATVVRRFYGVAADRIENLAPLLMQGLRPFKREVPSGVSKLGFLGSLERAENREGLAWFVSNVLPGCPEVLVTVIGRSTPQHRIEHAQISYAGFVDDLPAALKQFDLMIAPLFSRAGVKIKVIESLMNQVPVLGTRAAFGGLPIPKGGRWRSDDPAVWIQMLSHGGLFCLGSPDAEACCSMIE